MLDKEKISYIELHVRTIFDTNRAVNVQSMIPVRTPAKHDTKQQTHSTLTHCSSIAWDSLSVCLCVFLTQNRQRACPRLVIPDMNIHFTNIGPKSAIISNEPVEYLQINIFFSAQLTEFQ